MSIVEQTAFRLVFALSICLGIASCASVTLDNYALPKEPPLLLADKTVAVLPFNGSAPPLAPAGEWFAYNLAKMDKIKVLSPAEVELLLHDQGKRELLPWKSLQDGAAIGKALGAQLVALGSLSSQTGMIRSDAVCEVTLIDVRNGETVGHYQVVEEIMGYMDLVVYYMRAANKAAYKIIGAKNQGDQR